MSFDPNPHSAPAAVLDGPLFTGLDIAAGIVAAIMILGPLTAAATHASHQGWPMQQSDSR